MSRNEVLRKMNIQTATDAGIRDSELREASLNDEFRIYKLLKVKTVR
jgi:hypothetical protein